MDPPHLKAYTLESVIAEKFQAGVYLAEANSRMKDFYDIYELCLGFDFDGATLYEAVFQTFERRKTDLPEVPALLSGSFPLTADKQTQWMAFQRRIGVSVDTGFPQVCEGIRGFLGPVYAALSRKECFTGHWDKVSRSWLPAPV
jgi:hypothetical protein